MLGESMWAMLLQRVFFATFTDRSVADAHASSQVLICLSAESYAEVDALAGRAVAAGAREVRSMDEGPMHGRSFADLDGHIWEILWMDPTAAG